MSGTQDVEVWREMILQILEILDTRRGTGTDGVSSHILKECKQQVRGPITDVVKLSIEDTRSNKRM